MTIHDPSLGTITNEDVIEQLEEIARLALRDYPYETSELDGNLLLTLGQISGLARRAIRNYQEHKK